MNWKMRVKKLLCRLYLGPFRVQGIEESLKTLVESRKSFARIGDGEFTLIRRDSALRFQKENELLSRRLRQVLEEPIDACWVGVPDTVAYFHNLTEESESFWVQYMYDTCRDWRALLRRDVTYLAANVTRPYIRYRDRSVSPGYFRLLKQLWEGRDVLMVEGEQTALGVGNDLFDGARSVCRILGPARDAFACYDAILEAAKRHGKDKLILIALGPTATVLAYDLAKAGFYAVDIGHIDVEYEWFRMGATKKVALTNRFVNEAAGGAQTEKVEDAAYLAQILERVTGKPRKQEDTDKTG